MIGSAEGLLAQIGVPATVTTANSALLFCWPLQGGSMAVGGLQHFMAHTLHPSGNKSLL